VVNRSRARAFPGLAALALLFFTAPALSGDGMTAAIPDLSGRIQTVRGLIEPGAAGMTLMHEHIFIDYSLPLDQPKKWASIGATYPGTPEAMDLWQRPLTPDIYPRLVLAWPANREALQLNDEAMAVQELDRFRLAGGGTVVELTSTGIGRTPAGLLRVAQATGLNVVMGAGWYRDEWLADDLSARSVEDMTAEIVRDITLGVDDTGIRSGIIGEVGVESHPPDDPLTAREIKSLMAAGRAAMITGAPLSLHTLLTPGQDLEVLDRLEADGVDLGRVIVGHLSAVVARDRDYLLGIARRGVFLEFDLLGFRESTVVEPFLDDRAVADAIAWLVEQGFGERILLSQDTATRLQLTHYGGYGYAFIPTYFLPHLRGLGLSEAQVRAFVADNPARALTFTKPRP
jgi:phosphotriesterase-related protein